MPLTLQYNHAPEIVLPCYSAMLIDDFLPHYDVRERHRVRVRAPLGEVYSAVRELDLRDARLSMLLFRLRGLPAGHSTPTCFKLDDFLKMRFVLLGENVNKELLLGLVGRFWTPSGKLRRVSVEGFRDFNEAGYAKAAWNFSLSELPDKTVRLETETRVLCLDEGSRRRFRLYWLLVGTFSGLIRKEILQVVKQSAERPRVTRSVNREDLSRASNSLFGEDRDGRAEF